MIRYPLGLLSHVAMPSVSRSVRRTPRGVGKGSLLSPLRSASPLRRPAKAKTPSSFSRLDDTGEPSPAGPSNSAAAGASNSAAATTAMTPSAVQPSATSAAAAPAPVSALALTMTTPYSGRPDPRRTLTPVDLDETPPPETPSNGGFTPTGTTFDSFGFPTDEKAAAAPASGAGGAAAGAAAVVENGTSNNTNSIDPFLSPSAASFANTGNNNNGNNNGNNSNASTPRVQQNTTNDPFLDLTVDDDGFVTWIRSCGNCCNGQY